ncbi:MAG: sigma-70 family RNA polymerase sigma factor [Anaerovoracaceae bacterium]
MRNETEARRAIDKYSDMVQRLCLIHLKNYADSEDVFQTVFLKYVLYSGTFESEEHEKAWLIRVTINECKDLLKSVYRKRVGFSDVLEKIVPEAAPENRAVLEAVLTLPKKYKNVIYLHYYEGYKATEIAKILNKKENTIYTLLARGREQLKELIGGKDLE